MSKWLIPGIVFILFAVRVGGEDAPETPSAANDKEQAAMQKTHRHFSAHCFNQCWGLIDKTDRTDKDVENMLLLAYTSLWHWKQRSDCKPLNLSIGYWQVSRVHALAGQYDMARLFGEKCLRVGEKNSLPPFYIGYAFEALARAEMVHGNVAAAKKYLGQANEQLEMVKDESEKELLEADLASLVEQLLQRPDSP